jgi:hypothetical protein
MNERSRSTFVGHHRDLGYVCDERTEGKRREISRARFFSARPERINLLNPSVLDGTRFAPAYNASMPADSPEMNAA